MSWDKLDLVILTHFLEFDIKLGTPGEVLHQYIICALADYSVCISLYQQAFLALLPGKRLLS